MISETRRFCRDYKLQFTPIKRLSRLSPKWKLKGFFFQDFEQNFNCSRYLNVSNEFQVNPDIMILILFSFCYFTSQWLAFSNLMHSNSCTNRDNPDSNRIDVPCLGHPCLGHRHQPHQHHRPHHLPVRNARRVGASSYTQAWLLPRICIHLQLCNLSRYQDTHNNQRLKGEKELVVPHQRWEGSDVDWQYSKYSLRTIFSLYV